MSCLVLRANLSAFRTFVRFALIWFCLFLLPLGVKEGLRFVIVVLSELFSYHLFFFSWTVLSLNFIACKYSVVFISTSTHLHFIRQYFSENTKLGDTKNLINFSFTTNKTPTIIKQTLSKKRISGIHKLNSKQIWSY